MMRFTTSLAVVVDGVVGRVLELSLPPMGSDDDADEGLWGGMLLSPA